MMVICLTNLVRICYLVISLSFLIFQLSGSTSKSLKRLMHPLYLAWGAMPGSSVAVDAEERTHYICI